MNQPEYYNLIRKNETINIPSIFMFGKDILKTVSFIEECRNNNCTVYFENEDFTLPPDRERSEMLELMLYNTMITNPKLMWHIISCYSNFEKRLASGKIEML